MSFGIQIKNIYNETQIDGLYKNFQVLSYGISAASVSSPSGFGNLCPVYAQFNTQTPIVMGRNVSTAAGNSIGASSYYYPNNTMNVGADSSMKYVILEPTAVAPGGGGSYGIEIYDPIGGVVFSTAQKNFIIDAVVTLTSTTRSSTHDITLPAVEFGQRYYQMLIRWGNQEDAEGYGVTYQELSATNIRVFLEEALGATGSRTVSFITGYFRE